MKIWKKILLVILVLLVLTGAAAAIPPVRERVAWRLDALWVRVRYTLFPPEKAVFVPEGAVATVVQATMQAYPSATPQPSITPTPPAETTTPMPTATPLPGSVSLKGVRYIDQHGKWNYCAPANLAMALSFWGWDGTRDDTGQYLKPQELDKNVMPYEMADYVSEKTDLKVALRYGGTLDGIKALVAGGFPVLVEKGTWLPEAATGKLGWMGHYEVVTGYDEEKQQFITQDSYIKPDYPVPYDRFEKEWRSFDYVFLVIYPAEREGDVLALLGDLADPTRADQIAAERASKEIFALDGVDQYFAWFNRGTSLLRLQDYAGAASAYDEAFKVYPDIAEATRPWRMLWYQTGPYFAYFYLGRYQDVINLATNTVEPVDKPYLEESFYWRGRARAALGDVEGAIADLRQALEYHPGFSPAVEALQQLGVNP